MSLPRPALPTGTVELDGVPVEFRSLSRVEALALQAYEGREDEAEDYMLSCALQISMEDAHAWREAVDLRTGQVLLTAIIEVSGLTEADRPLPRAPRALPSSSDTSEGS